MKAATREVEWRDVLRIRKACISQSQGTLSDTTQQHTSESLLTQMMPSDAIRSHTFESKLAQAMACCLTAPSHCMN